MRGHVLTINPSYAEEGERLFWDRLASRLAEHEITILELAARRIPGGPNRTTTIIPIRLADFGRRAAPALDGAELPRWLARNDLTLLLDWERRRWTGEDINDELATRGLIQLAQMVDTGVGHERPLMVLSTNKIDHPCYLSRLAASHYGVPWKMVERSPNENIWIENDGLFAESGIWKSSATEDWCDPAYDATGQAVLKRMRNNPAGFRAREIARLGTDPLRDDFDRPLFFLPVDNVLWTGWDQPEHPQRTVDYPHWPDPLAAIREVRDSVEKLGGTLLVKQHPSCRSITRERLGDDIKLVNEDIGTLIEKCDAVVGFNTKLLFVALAFEKPVICLSPNPVSVSDSCHTFDGSQSVTELLECAVKRDGDEQDRLQRFRRLCGWLESNYFLLGQTSPNQKSIPFNNLVTEIESLANRNTRDDLFFDKVDMLRQLSGEQRTSARKRIWPLPRPRSRHGTDAGNSITVYYDVWRLAQTGGSHVENSGINRYIRHLLSRLSRDEAIELRYVIYPERGVGQGRLESKFLSLAEEANQWLGVSDSVVFPVASDSLRDPGVWLSPMNSLPPIPITKGLPRILVVHDVIHLKGASYWDREPRPPIEAAVSSVQPERDFVICDSQATRRDLLGLCPVSEDRTYVVPLAYDHDVYDQPKTALTESLLHSLQLEPRGFVLALGQTEKRKNLGRLLQAFANLKHRKGERRFQLLIVLGDPRTEQSVRKAAELAGVDETLVRFVAGISDRMLASLYGRAACFAYVSLEEGFGIPIVEAMGAGCPVLTSNRSSMPEVAGDAAVLCDPLDVESIRHGLESILYDAVRREAMIQRGRIQTKQFSWDIVAETMVAILREIVEGRWSTDPKAALRSRFWAELEQS